MFSRNERELTLFERPADFAIVSGLPLRFFVFEACPPWRGLPAVAGGFKVLGPEFLLITNY